MAGNDKLRGCLYDQQKSCKSLSKVVTYGLAALILLSIPVSNAACSRENEKAQRPSYPQESPTATKKIGSLKAVFSTTKRRFQKSTVVPLELVIRNTGEKETQLRFQSAKTHDFLVKDSRGATIWRWSSDKFFAQSFLSKTLKSGEELTFTANWHQETSEKKRVLPGKYALVAEFNAIGRFLKTGPLWTQIAD